MRAGFHIWQLACILFLTTIGGCAAAEPYVHRSRKLSTFPVIQDLIRLRTNLEYHTVFSPQWKVTEDRGAKLAEIRNLAEFLRGMGHERLPEEVNVRVRIRFSAYQFGNSGWTTPDRVSTVEVNERRLDEVGINVWKDGTVFRSAFRIIASGLWFEIDESSPRLERRWTDATFEALTKLCEEVKRYSSTSEIRKRFASSRAEELTVTSLSEPGRYLVKGFINPEEEGLIWLRVFRKNGEELSAAKSRRTIEYTGWSPDKKDRFYFESELTIDGEGPDEDVRIEVWFEPKYERKLLGIDASVSKWTR